VRENGSRHFAWNHADQLIAFSVRANATAPASVEACYLYDGSGQRVKKWVRNQSGAVETTVYIDGVFERSTATGLANNTLHVMDGQNRVAMVRIGDPFPGEGARELPIKYHFGDHLGSSHVVIGVGPAVQNVLVNREEFYPYGETSYGGSGRKRYRFTGMERDEESGLQYHNARYYCAWLMRWASADPAGPSGGINVYVYCQGNPVIRVDRNGKLFWLIVIGVAIIFLKHDDPGGGSDHLVGLAAAACLPPAAIAMHGGFYAGRELSTARTAVEQIQGLPPQSSERREQLEQERREALFKAGVTATLAYGAAKLGETPSGVSRVNKTALKETTTMGSESLGEPVPDEWANKGSTAGTAKDSTAPRNLGEQLAVEEAFSRPNTGAQLPIKLGDSRWSSEDGWVKKEIKIVPQNPTPELLEPAKQDATSGPLVRPIGATEAHPLGNPNGTSPRPLDESITVHFVKNTRNGQIDDFKIKK
jgi:RHS repeat-associated protein